MELPELLNDTPGTNNCCSMMAHVHADDRSMRWLLLLLYF
jgi:hypothetical protein